LKSKLTAIRLKRRTSRYSEILPHERKSGHYSYYNEIHQRNYHYEKYFRWRVPFDVLIVRTTVLPTNRNKSKRYKRGFTDRQEHRRQTHYLSTAYIHGFKWALKKVTNSSTEMDADTTQSRNLARLY
jgi:dolichol-phosphate mannosyltransferase